MAKPKTPGSKTSRSGPSGGRRADAPQAAVAAGAPLAAETAAPKKRTSPAQFISQVRAEGRKIVWPSRKETWITSLMVFIMVLIAAAFFWIVDLVLGFGFQQIISFGS